MRSSSPLASSVTWYTVCTAAVLLALCVQRAECGAVTCGAAIQPPSVSSPVVALFRRGRHLECRPNLTKTRHSSLAFLDRDAECTTDDRSKSRTYTNNRNDHPPLAAVRGGSSAAVKTLTSRQMEFLNLFSGGAAGTLASCVTNPLEVIKTQLQSSNVIAGGRPAMRVARQILQTDGVPGFFRGLSPTLVGIIPSRSAYFYAYQRCKSYLDPVFPEGSPPNALISGLLAGMVGNTLTNPIWMVRTRMQLLADSAAGQIAYKGYGDVIGTIFREEGVRGFYKGIQASYWGCTEGAMQFLLYEQFKARLLKRANARRAVKGLPGTKELSHTEYFWSAAAAKMFAAVATYPHEVARTRMREQARQGVFKYKGMWQTIGVVASEEGRKGLYGGMGVHLLKVVPNSALMFLTYEVVRGWLNEFTVVDKE